MPNNQAELAEMLSADNTKASIERSVYKYTECGAWIELKPWGIRIGSIVEGSDNGTHTYALKYPFTEEEYRACEEAIEKEASAIWEWANVIHYYCIHQTLDANGKVLSACDYIGGENDIEYLGEQTVCPKCGNPIEGATSAEGGCDFPDIGMDFQNIKGFEHDWPLNETPLEGEENYDEMDELRKAALNRGQP